MWALFRRMGGPLLLWIFLGGGATAQTAEPLVTDRPDFTESAQTVPARRFQLEGGWTTTRMGRDRDDTFGELLLRAGLGKRAELRVGLNSYGIEHTSEGATSGFDDATLGVKIRLASAPSTPNLRRPDVCLIAATSLPTGGANRRDSHLQPEVKLCLGWELSPCAGLSANLNYAVPHEQGHSFSQFAAPVSLGYTLTERVGSFLEVFGFAPGGLDGPNRHFANGGLTYLVNGDLQLDIRAGTGVNGAANDYFAGAGVSRRW